MNKQTFLTQLEALLADLPQEERVAALQYYTEYFNDAGPEREAEVMEELESPEKVAADIRAASGDEGWVPPPRQAPAWHTPPQEEAQQKQKRNTNILLVVLIVVLLSPFWGSFLGVVFGLGVAILAVLAVPLIIGVAFVGASIGVLVLGIMLMLASPANGFVSLGVALVLLGLGLLLCYAGIKIFAKLVPGVVRGIASLGNKVVAWIRNL